MTIRLSAPDGSCWEVPALREWCVVWTDGSACDSIELTFPCAADDREKLARATRVWAYEDGKTVFCGVVDEATVTLDGHGRTALVSGRGLGARLRDNEVRAKTFARAFLADILAEYAAPYGIDRTSGTIPQTLASFAVDSGDTAWTALSGFCRHAAGRTPRFAPDGTLVLGAPETSPSLRFDGSAQALARRCRYGVLSEQVTVDRSTGRQTVAQNRAVADAGVCCRRVTAASGTLLHASDYTAEQRLAQSAGEWSTLTLTLPGGFLAEPGQLAQVTLDGLGIAGRYRVTEVTTRLDADGLTCQIEMREEDT